ncbi:hypothetical protein GCM10009775_17780 [Microbacterium aoyamense]|uniref:SAF domain-containing protein n=1 Tax=Microbacterium aoyamense TaxID=344166 RepID=A0ABP5B110_9MICO|nr:SAF domain-containing protein [Microbacterium aoyamense]
MTAPDPSRTRRPAIWSDARFLLGIALVVASIAGVWFVVTSARQTTPVVAVIRTIAPGETVTADDVRLVEVALGPVDGVYATQADLAEGVVATRTISSGELLPAEAIGSADDTRTTSVVLRSAADVPSSVAAGTVVEVWAAPLVERGVYDAPRILVADATVVAVTRDDSVMGGGAAALEVVIARSEVSDVLSAIAGESALSVVPTSGARR